MSVIASSFSFLFGGAVLKARVELFPRRKKRKKREEEEEEAFFFKLSSTTKTNSSSKQEVRLLSQRELPQEARTEEGNITERVIRVQVNFFL